MSTEPRVSVVIPTFNRARLLPSAIESALGQTLREIEVIVVDDGSDDGTDRVVGAHDDARLRLIRREHIGLQAAVRNAGIEAARSEYVAFLDSDDAWLPEKLERQVAILDAQSGVALVCTNAYVMNRRGRCSGELYLRADQGESGRVLCSLVADNFVIASTVVARRSLAENVGGFSEEPLLRGVEDYDLWLRLGAVADVMYLPTPLALYREHRSSIRREIARTTHWHSLLRVLERLETSLPDPVRDDPELREALARAAEHHRERLAEAERVETTPPSRRGRRLLTSLRRRQSRSARP